APKSGGAGRCRARAGWWSEWAMGSVRRGGDALVLKQLRVAPGQGGHLRRRALIFAQPRPGQAADDRLTAGLADVAADPVEAARVPLVDIADDDDGHEDAADHDRRSGMFAEDRGHG